MSVIQGFTFACSESAGAVRERQRFEKSEVQEEKPSLQRKNTFYHNREALIQDKRFMSGLCLNDPSNESVVTVKLSAYLSS